MTTTAGVTYTYDGDGRRVQKSSGKLYWYGTGADPLVETDLAGNNPTEFVFFNGKRIARRDAAGAVFYFFSDHLSSSRVVTNATGTVVEDSDFYPFGGERSVVDLLSNQNYKFTGKERDSESGLDYFGARYYSFAHGRFASADPSALSEDGANPQTWNRYSYVLNKPLGGIDPNGKWPQWIHSQIIDNAFRYSLSKQDRGFLKYASKTVDRDQSLEGAYKHGMSFPGQDFGSAVLDANYYIHQQLKIGVEAQLSAEYLGLVAPGENYSIALAHFGYALHTVTDMSSPQHAGGQVWRGMGHPLSWVHGLSEGVGAAALRRGDIIRAQIDAERLWERYQRDLAKAREKAEEEKKKKKEPPPPTFDYES